LRTLAVVALLAFGPAHAGPFALEPVALDIPAGFVGPQLAAGRPASPSFAMFDNCGLQSTVLQLDVREAGRGPRLLQTGSAASPSTTPADFLSGIEDPPAELTGGPVEAVRLGGLPGHRIAWRGRTADGEATGVSYAVLVGSRLVSLHVYEAGSAPSPPMRDAMQAIEALRLAR
jgi:hypothetical protein